MMGVVFVVVITPPVPIVRVCQGVVQYLMNAVYVAEMVLLMGCAMALQQNSCIINLTSRLFISF
jgi:hypothetical protein